MTKPISKGRFAPSPTGPLHFGSLVCAVASYADIKNKHGSWLVRIEDIDPPREIKGATHQILLQLEAHGLVWDEEVLYQSNRLDLYFDVVNDLQNKGLAYFCDCTRARLLDLKSIYDGHCQSRQLGPKDNSVRVIIDPSLQRSIFDDVIFGRQEQNLIQKVGDFVIKRRDGLISYQLAVTIDDSAQGITDIVRGADLLNSTHRQLFLQRILQLPQPKYAHITVATSDDNLKLSKQNFASELPYGRESENLFVALNWLNQNPPNDLRFLSPGKIMEWSVENWDRASLLPELARHAPPGFY